MSRHTLLGQKLLLPTCMYSTLEALARLLLALAILLSGVLLYPMTIKSLASNQWLDVDTTVID